MKVVNALRILRKKLGEKKLIVVSPENVTIYPQKDQKIPDYNTGLNFKILLLLSSKDNLSQGVGWPNYFVPIINASIDLIDLVQPQFYNNYYVDRSHVGDVQV